MRVTTGRVSVYEDKASPGKSARNGVILTPNQRVVYEKRTKTLTPGLVENPAAVKPQASPQEFLFNETPLPLVLDALREAYGVDIVLENEALNRCVFTADLNGLPLYAQLDLLCRSVNATYERRGTSLFVNGEGCD